MKRFHLTFLGRFGNCMFEYAFARGFCERYGFELHTDPWPGERIFYIDHPRCREELPRRDENTLIPGEGDVSYRSYSQRQKCANYYSLAQVRQWFRFRPNVEAALQALIPAPDAILAHHRHGDLLGYSYPVVGRDAYVAACAQHRLDSSKLVFVSEEEPTTHPEFTGELAFVPDFFRLAKATTLLRGNSSFSFWAGAIGGGRVFSPVIDRLRGGTIHPDISFLEGNHPKIADFDFVEEIRISP